MNQKLLHYIDNHLDHFSSEPMEQLVYVVAKLSLISKPAAWVIRRGKPQADVPFLSQSAALSFLKKHGTGEDYVVPLFPTVKVDICAANIRHLLTPLKDEGD